MTDASKLLIELHLDIRQKDERISQLESQRDALKATVESFTKDNIHLRGVLRQVETELQLQWTKAEVLEGMMLKFWSTVRETKDALGIA
jgi:hypothetical protein